MMTKITVVIIAFLLLQLASCSENNDNNTEKTLTRFVRDYNNTPALELAKAVEEENIALIKNLATKEIINYQDSIYGLTVLTNAVLEEKYLACKTLLENGADPNIISIHRETNVNPDTMYALYVAVGYENRNKFVPLLLKYGATKNINCDINDSTHPESAMISAAESGNLNAIKEMEKYGGNVHIICPKHWTMLGHSLFITNIFVLRYLIIEKKVDINCFKIEKPPVPEHNNILFHLREMNFNLNTEEHKAKIQVAKYLLENFGLDYWKEPVPYRFRNLEPEYLKKY